jgi:signal transduction histidine kinase
MQLIMTRPSSTSPGKRMAPARQQRQRVQAELRARLRQQAVVVELGGLALAGVELGTLMDQAARLVAQTLEVEFCKILEPLPNHQALLLRAGVGWKEGYVGHRRISAGLGSHAGFTLVSSEPVIIRDLRSETRFTEPLLHEHGVLSGISVIIEGQGRPFGVLGAHTRAVRQFTRDDVNFLQAVANVVATAIQRRRAEELLRRTEKLAVVGRLAATIAHEINNPLESVTNLLYLLEHHPALDATARNYATLAQQELHRVAHIARQTLSFYREPAMPVAVQLSELLDNVLLMHSRRIAEAGICVEKRYEFREPVKLFPAEMQQVMSNLVLNAVEALGNSGKLIVRLVPGCDWRNPNRRGVRLVVADSGPGIPPELRHQIFEPFFTTKDAKGTGLGLWVIHGIVQKHSGSVRLRSCVTPGRSFTCFSVFIPAESVPAHRQAVANPGPLAA